MEYIIILSITIVAAFVIWLFNRWQRKHPNVDAFDVNIDIAEKSKEAEYLSSCASSTGCDSCASACSDMERPKPRKGPTYYDDEELDEWAGTQAEAYNDEQVAQFDYILDTMDVNDIEGWLKSLNERKITLPKSVAIKASDRLLQKV